MNGAKWYFRMLSSTDQHGELHEAVEDLDKEVDYVLGRTDNHYQPFQQSGVGFSRSVGGCYPSARSAYRRIRTSDCILHYITQTRYMYSIIGHRSPSFPNGFKTPFSRIYVQFCVQRYIICQCTLQRFLQKTHVNCIASACTMRRKWTKMCQNTHAWAIIRELE